MILGRAIGFEISKECVEASVKKYPRLIDKTTNKSCVHLCNVLSSEGTKVVNDFASQANTAFIDIGGDRHAEAVIHFCEHSLNHPNQLIIKCRLLFRAARDYIKNDKKEIAAAAADNDDEKVFDDITTTSAMTIGGATVTETTATGLETIPLSKESNNNMPLNNITQPSNLMLKENEEIEHLLSQWWRDLIDKINTNGLNSGAAGLGAPRWHQNQPKRRMLAEMKRNQQAATLESESLSFASGPASSPTKIPKNNVIALS